MKRFSVFILVALLLCISCVTSNDIYTLAERVSKDDAVDVSSIEKAALLWEQDTSGLDPLSIAKYWNSTADAYRIILTEEKWNNRNSAVLSAAYDNAFDERLLLDKTYAVDAEPYILEDLRVYLNEDHSNQELLETAFYLKYIGLLLSDCGLAIRPYIENALIADDDRLILDDNEYFKLKELELFEARLRYADIEEFLDLIDKLNEKGILKKFVDVVMEIVLEYSDSCIIHDIYPYLQENGIYVLLKPLKAEIVDMAFYYVKDLMWLSENSFYEQFPKWIWESHSELVDMYDSSMEELIAVYEIVDLDEATVEKGVFDPESYINLYWLCEEYLKEYDYFEQYVKELQNEIEPYCIWYSTDSFNALMEIPESYRRAEVITYDLGNSIKTNHTFEELFTSQIFTMFDFEVFEPGIWDGEPYDLIIRAIPLPGILPDRFSYIFSFDYRLGKLHLVKAQSFSSRPDENTYDIYKSFFIKRDWAKDLGDTLLKGLFFLDFLFGNH